MGGVTAPARATLPYRTPLWRASHFFCLRGTALPPTACGTTTCCHSPLTSRNCLPSAHAMHHTYACCTACHSCFFSVVTRSNCWAAWRDVCMRQQLVGSRRYGRKGMGSASTRSKTPFAAAAALSALPRRVHRSTAVPTRSPRVRRAPIKALKTAALVAALARENWRRALGGEGPTSYAWFSAGRSRLPGALHGNLKRAKRAAAPAQCYCCGCGRLLHCLLPFSLPLLLPALPNFPASLCLASAPLPRLPSALPPPSLLLLSQHLPSLLDRQILTCRPRHPPAASRTISLHMRHL